MGKISFNDFPAEMKMIGADLNQALLTVMNSGWFILGPQVKKFEQEFAQYLGSKYCIGVGNGLEAIQISLMALGIGKGDEVITTPLSAVATTLAILAVGAKPVFVDIDENGLINLDLIEANITTKTKAILPVHLYGQVCDLSNLSKLCKKHSIFLVEDAAQAHGAKWRSKFAGTVGMLGCFSFYPTKNVGALGDGGAIVTDSKKFANLCFQMRDYGQKKKYIHQVFGLNSRLDELQAAFLRIKLKHLEQLNKKRLKLAEVYKENLTSISEVEVISSSTESQPNGHLFVIKVPHRDQLQKFLQTVQIDSLVHYPLSIPDQPCFNHQYQNYQLPVCRRFVKQVLSLPCHPYMQPAEIELVCDKIREFYRH